RRVARLLYLVSELLCSAVLFRAPSPVDLSALSLHDALPICLAPLLRGVMGDSLLQVLARPPWAASRQYCGELWLAHSVLCLRGQLGRALVWTPVTSRPRMPASDLLDNEGQNGDGSPLAHTVG